MQARNIAARAGRWSAGHRRTAILGWIAFVVLATVGGSLIDTRELSSAEQGNGSSRAAGLAVDAAGFRETTGEQVLLQARTGDATASRRAARRTAAARGAGRAGALAV